MHEMREEIECRKCRKCRKLEREVQFFTKVISKKIDVLAEIAKHSNNKKQVRNINQQLQGILITLKGISSSITYEMEERKRV